MLLPSYHTDHLDSIGSTNSYVKESIRRGGAEQQVVRARLQTAGRGRGENTWESPEGGIYLTVAAPVNSRYSRESLGARISLAVRDCLAARFGLAIAVKWPNDLLYGGRKLAGCLLELIKAPSGVDVLVVGLGVNVNATPADSPGMWYPPTSICREIGSEAELPALAEELAKTIHLAVFENEAPYRPDDALLEMLRTVSGTIGHEVIVRLPGGDTVTGLARDINRRFALMVEHGGMVVEVEAGDCVPAVTKEKESSWKKD